LGPEEEVEAVASQEGNPDSVVVVVSEDPVEALGQGTRDFGQ